MERIPGLLWTLSIRAQRFRSFWLRSWRLPGCRARADPFSRSDSDGASRPLHARTMPSIQAKRAAPARSRCRIRDDVKLGGPAAVGADRGRAEQASVKAH